MRKSTKDMLATATLANVETVLKHARKRGWQDNSIERHGNKVVQAALILGMSAVNATARRVRQVAQRQPVVAVPRAAKVSVGKPVKAQLVRVKVRWNTKELVGILDIGAARKKQAPSDGVTHDCGLGFSDVGWLSKGAYLFTLSTLAAKRLVGGERVAVWLDSKSHVLTMHDNQNIQ